MNNFNWQEFLRTAKEIFESVKNLQQIEMSDEALCRTGISRAYYAVFHHAAPLVDSDLQKGGTHEKLIKALSFEISQRPAGRFFYWQD